MRWALLLLLGCGGDKAPAEKGALSDDSAADPADTATDTALPAPVRHSIEEVARTIIRGLDGVRAAVTHPTHGTTFVLDQAGLNIRTLSHTWVHPYGAYCLGGSYDDEGVCRGGTERESGLLSTPQAAANWCVDGKNHTLILVKENGTRLEVVDAGKTGPDAYTHLQALASRDLPAALSASASYTGPCVALPDERAVVLSSAAHQALAVVSVEGGQLLRKGLLEFEPAALAIEGGVIIALDSSQDRVVQLSAVSLAEIDHVVLDGAASEMAVGAGSRVAWLSMVDGGVQRVVMGAADHGMVSEIPLTGPVSALVADGHRGLAWAAVEDAGVWRVTLLSALGVEAEWPVDGPILALGVPNRRGDVAVFIAGEDGDVELTVLAPRPDIEAGPPLYSFLFTTIEEPSALNMDIPCVGGDTNFARELSLVRNNAAIVASLGLPVALGITDNFAQKAEACGETVIFDELASYGFTMGVLVHNKPCFDCTDGTHDANPVHCARDSPHWARATSTTACFPDDPDYCPLGDWDCYRDYMTPRVSLVDRNIPGGAHFISGADRHRMWDYDWIRLYQEVERPSTDRSGFDLSLFASAWAYDEVENGDVRGKDLAPWALEDKTAAWHLGDIAHWTQDAPRSEVLYLPGVSWSTVKLSEQQLSGLYMIDFFSSGAPIAYQTADYEAVFQDLRTAIAHRREGETNSWYFHIHDLGTLNLRDVHNDPLMTDPDGTDGPEEPVPTETLLQAFIDQVDARYGGSPAFEWANVSDIKRIADGG
jgi:hypothetical protein